MSRLDQKFLIHGDWIPALLNTCREHYHILEVEGLRTSGYSNRFIETNDFDSFHQHARGRNIRFKARIRHYASNARAFLEVKQKTVHGRTVKSRIERAPEAGIHEPLTPREVAFLAEHYGYPNPQLTSVSCTFNRFTLVSNDQSERITFDMDIAYRSTDRLEHLGALVIMEVKQANIERSSPMLNALKEFRFNHTPLGRRISLSKYVVGMLLLNPNLPPRAYRSDIQRIRKLREHFYTHD